MSDDIPVFNVGAMRAFLEIIAAAPHYRIRDRGYAHAEYFNAVLAWSAGLIKRLTYDKTEYMCFTDKGWDFLLELRSEPVWEAVQDALMQDENALPSLGSLSEFMAELRRARVRKLATEAAKETS